MDYTPDEAQLKQLVTRQIRWGDGQVPLYIGLGAWRLGDAPAVAQQIKRSRELGADGFVLFHYNDSEIATDRLPQLHFRQTSGEATEPHNAPVVEFDLPSGLPLAHPHTYPDGTALAFEARLRPKDTPGGGISFARGKVSLQTLDGHVVQKLGEMAFYSRGRQRIQTKSLKPGTYRLVWDGLTRRKNQVVEPSISRGPVVTILPQGAVQP